MYVSLKGCELLDQTLAQRRQRLELLLPDLHPCLQLVEQTASIELARDWLASYRRLRAWSPNGLMDGTDQASAAGLKSSASARWIALSSAWRAMHALQR